MPTTERGLARSDVMILIGATALGLAIVRPFASRLLDDLCTAHSITEAIEIAMKAAWPCVVAWTVGVFIMELRRRPNVHELIRRPGAAACGTATVVLILGILPFLAFALSRRFRVRETTSEVLFSWWSDSNVPSYIGLVIAMAWLTLAVKGEWPPARDRIDRAGRLLGIAWIGRLVGFAIIHAFRIVESLRSPEFVD